MGFDFLVTHVEIDLPVDEGDADPFGKIVRLHPGAEAGQGEGARGYDEVVSICNHGDRRRRGNRGTAARRACDGCHEGSPWPDVRSRRPGPIPADALHHAPPDEVLQGWLAGSPLHPTAVAGTVGHSINPPPHEVRPCSASHGSRPGSMPSTGGTSRCSVSARGRA